MTIPFFTLKRQQYNLKDELQKAFSKVMSIGNFVLGEEVVLFENSFANYLGVGHCITCANGTDAIELILEGLGIRNGDEVILPDNTWMSVAEAVIRSGGRPIFCDIDKDSMNISIHSLKGCLTDKTFAVIGVHQFGKPIDEIVELKSILTAQSIYLIEDCAHASGATIENRKCGSLADAASFSFYPTKNLGALGDGGAITTNNKKLAERILLLRNHGQKERDHHLLSGRNSRLDELQAAFLNVKLAYLDHWNNRRREIARMYLEGLGGIEGLILPNTQIDNSIYHQYVIQVDRRDELLDYLLKNGVGSAIHYPATISSILNIDQEPMNECAIMLSKKVLSLPIFPELLDAEIHHVMKVIKIFFK